MDITEDQAKSLKPFIYALEDLFMNYRVYPVRDWDRTLYQIDENLHHAILALLNHDATRSMLPKRIMEQSHQQIAAAARQR